MTVKDSVWPTKDQSRFAAPDWESHWHKPDRFTPVNDRFDSEALSKMAAGRDKANRVLKEGRAAAAASRAREYAPKDD